METIEAYELKVSTNSCQWVHEYIWLPEVKVWFILSNIFCCEAAKPIEPKFHVVFIG